MLVAVAVGWDGRRSVLGIELANRESRSSWRDFLLGLKERGLPFAGSCPRRCAHRIERLLTLDGVAFPRPATAGRSCGDGADALPRLVADDHRAFGPIPRRDVGEASRAGLRAALREALAEAAYQRCYVHFLRNALDYVPRLSAPLTSRRGIGRSPMVDDDCLQGRTTPSFDRWLYDRRDLSEARRDLAAPSALH